MKHDVKLRVRTVRRESSRVGSVITIVADCLEETPHLGVMKARVDNMVEMERLLRKLVAVALMPGGEGARAAREEANYQALLRAADLISQLDAVDQPRAPGPPTDPWDQLRLDGEIAPAHCQIRFDDPAPKTHNHKGMAIGYDPGRFDLELLVLPENVAACEDFVRKLWPYKPGETAKLVSYRAEHPELALRGIRQVAIIGVRSGEGPEPGTRLFVLRAVQYVPKRAAKE